MDKGKVDKRKRSRSRPRVSEPLRAQAIEQAREEARGAAGGPSHTEPLEHEIEFELEEQPMSPDEVAAQEPRPLSRQERVDPTGWEEKFKNWEDVGTSLTRDWPSRDALEQTEYRFADKHGITLKRKLGEGGQASVWLCDLKDSATGESREMACKAMSLINYSNNKRKALNEAVKDMINETNITEGLQHPNILSTHSVFNMHDADTQFPYVRVLMIMELCAGDVKNWVDAKEPYLLSEDEARPIMAQICQGVKYLHDNGLAHLDIKPSNVLYTEDSSGNRCYKLCDFSYSMKFTPGQTIRSRFGTPVYRAPEMNDKLDASPPKADIYSLSITMLHLLVSRGNISKLSYDMSVNSARDFKKILVLMNLHLTNEAIILMKRMAFMAAQNRPDIDTVIADKWFTDPKPQPKPSVPEPGTDPSADGAQGGEKSAAP